MRRLLFTVRYNFSISMIRNLLRKWRKSSKVAFAVQKAKFTHYNISYYLRWWISLCNRGELHRIKVMDEVHFDARSEYTLFRRWNCTHLLTELQARRRVWAQRGVRSSNATLADSGLHESYNVTAMCSLSASQAPILIDIRRGSNNQFDFAHFILASVTNGYLRAGEILLLDNASVSRLTGSNCHLNKAIGSRWIDFSSGVWNFEELWYSNSLPTFLFSRIISHWVPVWYHKNLHSLSEITRWIAAPLNLKRICHNNVITCDERGPLCHHSLLRKSLFSPASVRIRIKLIQSYYSASRPSTTHLRMYTRNWKECFKDR